MLMNLQEPTVYDSTKNDPILFPRKQRSARKDGQVARAVFPLTADEDQLTVLAWVSPMQGKGVKKKQNKSSRHSELRQCIYIPFYWLIFRVSHEL